MLNNIEELSEGILNDVSSSKELCFRYTKRPKDFGIWSELNKKVFKHNKNIRLNLQGIASESGTWEDISFLKDLDEVELLTIWDFEIKSLEPIKHIKNLRRLKLNANSKNSLKPLEKFKNLETLTLTWLKKDIEVLSGFTKLKELHLTAIPAVDNFDFLKPLSKLKGLFFYETYDLSANSFDILPEIGKIESLLFTQMAELHNIDFVAKMPYLKHLELWALPIKALPQFPKKSPLEWVTISNLDDLEDIMGLRDLQNFKLFESLNATERVDKLLELQISQLENIMNRELTW